MDLANISREMGGEYVCNADNGVSAGPVWQTIDINVLCKLFFQFILFVFSVLRKISLYDEAASPLYYTIFNIVLQN